MSKVKPDANDLRRLIGYTMITFMSVFIFFHSYGLFIYSRQSRHFILVGLSAHFSLLFLISFIIIGITLRNGLGIYWL